MDKQREKLIDLIQNSVGYCATYWATRIADHLLADKEIKHAFELLKAEKEGRLIVPPCKVGDMVYSLSGEGIFRQIVKFIETDKHSQIRLRCECDLDCNKCPHMGCWNEYRYRAYGLDDIGKTVFLTREEAEAALPGEGGKHETD